LPALTLPFAALVAPGGGVGVHVRLIFTLAWCKTRKVFFNKDAELLPVLVLLLASYRDLLAIRPRADGRLGQANSDFVGRQESSGILARGATFDFVPKLTATWKRGDCLHDALISQLVDLAARQAQSDRIVSNSEFHGVFSLLSNLHLIMKRRAGAPK
jgi:hypothetical protein